MVSNVTMTPLPGYQMPTGPTAAETWEAAGTPYGASQTYMPPGSYPGDPSYFAPAANPQYYVNDPAVVQNPALSPEWSNAITGALSPPNTGGSANAIPPTYPDFSTPDSGNYIPPGGGSGNQNPNTGGGNVSVPGLDPGAGGGTVGGSLGNQNPNAAVPPPGFQGTSTGPGLGEFFYPSNPAIGVATAFEGMGAPWNINDPIVQTIGSMSSGLPYLYGALGGANGMSDPGGFQDYATQFTQGLFGQGNTMGFQDVQNLFSSVLNPNNAVGGLLDQAIGDKAGAGAGILKAMLGSTLPTTVMPQFASLYYNAADQALADYMIQYGQGLAGGAESIGYSLGDYLSGVGVDSPFLGALFGQ